MGMALRRPGDNPACGRCHYPLVERLVCNDPTTPGGIGRSWMCSRIRYGIDSTTAAAGLRIRTNGCGSPGSTTPSTRAAGSLRIPGT
jgi:hypothetical protein